MTLSKLNVYYLPIGAFSFAVGAITTVGALTFHISRNLKDFDLGAAGWTELVCGVAMLLIGTVAGAVGIAQLTDVAGQEKSECSRVLYQRYLVGVGYALLVLAVLNLVTLAGLAQGGALQSVFPVDPAATRSAAGAQDNFSAPSAVVLLFTLSMAILGALFFMANSLQEMQDRDIEFDDALFWGGLWYRLGESVLFAIVAFLFFRSFGSGTEHDLFTLPILALVMGMFIRTGEQVIFGLSKRLLLGAKALIPMEPAETGTQTAAGGGQRQLDTRTETTTP